MNKLDLKEAPCIFDEVAHTYTARKDSKLWPGTTTICGLLDKPFLMSWAAKEVVTFLAGRQEEIKELDKAGYLKLLDEAKMSYRRKSKEALTSGSTAHDWIEAHIKAQIEGRVIEGGPETIEDKKARASVLAFLEWEKSHEIVWMASELVVGSEMHEFGGKLDGLALVDEVMTLVDFKTSNQISKDYFLQTAAYQMALEEMGQAIDQRLILRIPKTGGEFEALVVPTPYDLDASTFLGLRQAQRWVSYIDNQERGIVDERGKVVADKKITT